MNSGCWELCENCWELCENSGRQMIGICFEVQPPRTTENSRIPPCIFFHLRLSVVIAGHSFASNAGWSLEARQSSVLD